MSTRPLRLLAVGAASTLVTLLIAPSAGAADQPTLPGLHARAGSDATLAQQALTDAKSLFSGNSSRLSARARAQGKTVRGRDATMVLRDLAVRADDLPTASQRAQADRILARPTDGYAVDGEPKYKAGSPVGSDCGPHICVHWVEDGTVDAVKDDGNVHTYPAQAATTLTTMEHVYAKEVTSMGYHAPLSDIDSTDNGGNKELDVYLADVGSNDLYGYCAGDGPAQGSPSDLKVAAYCVLDNDYARSQFPDNTPLENLQVTAAHEFFHAVQFSYNWDQDLWFMEGTAAWMEDEVYDNINDNRQYLADSPLTNPYVPIDYTSDDYQPYGAWIFWRFLSERAHTPTIIRKVWEQGAGHYSTWALNRVLRAQGSSFASWFSAFGSWTASPSTYFSEGSAYPRALPDGSYTLSSSRTSIGARQVKISHMARSFLTFKPSSSLSRTVKLKLSVNMTNTSHGSIAQLVVHRKDGHLTVHPIKLNSSGNATTTYGFDPRVVSYLKLDLANASTKFHCGEDTMMTCNGEGYYDYQPARFSASLTH